MATKKRRVKSKGTTATAAATKKIGKRIYKKVSCAKTKTAAKSIAKKLRADGKAARVVSTKAAGTCKHAVYASTAKKRASVGRKRKTIRKRK